MDISPNGRYRTETRLIRWIGEGGGYETLTIADAAVGQTITTVSYVDSSNFRWAGQGWLNNELYLIGQTGDQGVLYVSLPEGRIGHLLPDFFGLAAREEEDVCLVDRQADPATGKYHLLLQLCEEGRGLPLLLYHSELDQVEEVAFYFAWPFFDSSSFTPDGQWLLLGDPIEKGEPGVSINYWLRLVDPPGSTAIEIIPGVEFDGLSGQGQQMAEIVAEAVLHSWMFCRLSGQAQQMAFCRDNSVRILSFPDGKLLGQWSTASYDVRYLWWSPDGNRAVATGFDAQTEKEALFAIPIP